MSYLIDTNVQSKLHRREPNPTVVAWFEERPVTTLTHDLRMVIRNARDFYHPVLEVINSWEQSAE